MSLEQPSAATLAILLSAIKSTLVICERVSSSNPDMRTNAWRLLIYYSAILARASLVNHCISHVKDADGLCSAALTLAAKWRDSFRLTDYDQLIDELNGIPKDATELVLCDLGTDPSRFEEFEAKMEELTKRLKVTYIDHHYLSTEMKGELQRLGIHLVHDVDECSSMLTYSTFNRLLPAESSYLAMFGAVTDYMDSSPLAGKMMERFDRQFVLLESTLLSYAISNQGRRPRGTSRCLVRVPVKDGGAPHDRGSERRSRSGRPRRSGSSSRRGRVEG
jgi:hypothetical protein